VTRVVYEPTANLAYGMDATNRQFSRIDLATGIVTIGPRTLQIPNAACLDTQRNRLFVVNKGSSFITEYDATTLAAVRDIAWGGTDADPEDTQFRIYCGADRLYVTDGKYSPGLWIVDALDTATPRAVDHGTEASGVGSFALNAAGSDLYYAYQPYWGDCGTTTYVRRLDAIKLTQIDKSATNLASFPCGPIDSALLLDESRGLVFVRNRVFNATNLANVVYTLPSLNDVLDGLTENVYALDATRGLLATKNFIFELGGYTVVAATLKPPADQLFFDKAGTLWTLTITESALKAQIIRR
jgi:hypothetical protein